MLVTNAEYNIDSLAVTIACTARFDGVKRRVPVDMDNEFYAEFYKQAEDGTIQPINVYE